MAELDKLETRVGRLEESLDALTRTIDKGFDGADAAFFDLRHYIDQAFGTLSAEMQSGVRRVDGRFDHVHRRFEQVNERFDQIDQRFDQIDQRFGQIDSRFGQIDSRFGQMDSRFERLERKLDQFIDTQSKTNELTERRLIRLESA